MSEIRSRLLNSVRATWLAVETAARHAVTIRSTSLKRASISSVSLYLSTFILAWALGPLEPMESTRHHPDRQAFEVTLPYIQLHISCDLISVIRKISANLRRLRGRNAAREVRASIGAAERGTRVPITSKWWSLL